MTLEILPIIQIILSALLTLCVLLQYSAAGVGGAMGGGDSFSTIEHTRRGFEKFLFYGTIVIAILFVITSLLSIIK